ncbi:MAG: prenyltransferase/squalene oxidase repeat-containing protein [Isosphaeraceae bacterium]
MTREEVERAIRDGIRYLKQAQREDGSWEEMNMQARTGTTSLITLALLTAGEKPEEPHIRKALEHLRRFGPEDLRSTYAIALQTMVFAAADPERDQLRIAANVSWLEGAQLKPGSRLAGCWTYSETPAGGDNSNTQYALLGLNAAAEAGVPVKPEVWALARLYWERAQRRDGGWGYHAGDQISTASMTCAGISSLVITGSKRFQGQEYLQGGLIHNCGQVGVNRNLQGAWTGWRPTSAWARTSPWASSGSSIISTAWSGPAGSPASASSASTTGTDSVPTSWSRPRTGSPASGGA